MKKNILKRALTLALAALLALSLFACGKKNNDNSTSTSGATSYKVGICNYVDDASLNQIVDNIKTQLAAIGQEKGVTFEISYDNCNADSAVLNQIIANFIADKVDLMIGVATPVAVAMQAATEGTDIPVVFAAVSDPVSAGLVESLEAPGANITGTSDYLDTDAILDLIFAANPDAKNIALLYDQGQDSSTTPIKNAKAYLDKKGVSYKEYNGTTTDEISLAVGSIVADAASTVTSSAAILRSGIGIVGVVSVAAMCVTPYLQFAVHYVLYKLAAGIAESFADKRVGRLIDGFADVYGFLLGMVGVASLILFLSIVSSMKAVTG